MASRKYLGIFPLVFLFSAQAVRAHCPLCTIGAAAAAGGAAYLGVNTAVIGVFIGAFAVSIGWWFEGWIRTKIKKTIPFQKTAIILFSFVSTVVPLMPLLSKDVPWYVSWAGSYGSLLNKVYMVDMFLVGSVIGSVIVCTTPWLSMKIGEWRGKMMPYQGILLTLVLLVIAGAIVQVVTMVV